jgi:predicted HTH domain antitoxin
MMVDVPEPIARLLPSDPVQRKRSVLEGVVIGAYTQGIISRGRASELLGLNYWEGDKFFAERGVFVNYDLQEFQQDLAN